VIHRYEDALVAKLRLLEFTESGNGLRYLHGVQASMNAMHQPDERLPDGMIHALQMRVLREAEPIYVSADMTDLVDHARATFEPETLLPSDPFCPTGFAVFPRAVLLNDAPRTEANPLRSPQGLIPVRALAWQSVHSEDLSVGCFWISHYTHVDDDLEYGRHEGPNGERLDEEGIAWFRRLAPLSLVHTWQWTWGVDPREARAGLVEGESPEDSQARANEQASFIQTFWRLAQQFVPIKRRAPRQIWRDAIRKGAKDFRDVNVVLLRRERTEYEEQAEDGSGRHYSVSFPVRGYWAKRHTREGPRQVWVRPHMKGQGPLKITDRAWEFRR
jgi:hypothetical protein